MSAKSGRKGTARSRLISAAQAPSQESYETMAQRLIDNGCDSLILGCTEVGMLLGDHNVPVPVFDTTKLHCEAALHAAIT